MGLGTPPATALGPFPHVQVHLRHLLGQVQAMGHQLLRWQHAIHQAPSHGLFGTDETTCQGQALLGSSWILAGWWFQPSPLKNMSSSVGMMTFPIYGNMKNVPHHQPAGDILSCFFLERNWLFWSKHGEKRAGAIAQLCPSLGNLEDLMDELKPTSDISETSNITIMMMDLL